MGNDFKFGWNNPGAMPTVPTYAPADYLPGGEWEDQFSEWQEPDIRELCSEVRAAITAVTQHVRAKGESMDLGAHYDNASKNGGGKGYKRRDFLKAVHLPAKGCTAKIIEFREASKSMEYSDFLVDLSIGKKEYTWGLKSKTVTLNMLIDALGKRTEKWAGKTIKLVRGGPKGQYVNLG